MKSTQNEPGTMSPDLSPKQAALIFWTTTLSLFCLWVLLPTLLHAGYRGDVLELLLTGKEWVWATRKHPMLPAWLLEIIVQLTGRSHAAPFIASQFCAFVTLWSVWTLGRQVLSQRLALVGALVMLPYWFFTVESVKYNQNIPLIALWTLSILLVFQAFQTNRLRYWLGAGLSIGLTFHSKYSAVFLVVTILVYMTFRPEGRRHWKKVGPYLTTLTAFLVVLPQILWLYADDFSTLGYAARKTMNPAWWRHLFFPLRFVVCELVYLIPPLIALTPMLGLPWKRAYPEEAKRKDCGVFLLYCMAVPFVLHLLIAAVLGAKLNGEYGAAFWPYFGVLLLLLFQSRPGKSLLATCTLVAVFEVALIVAFLLQAIVSPYVLKDPRRFHVPVHALGAACDRLWDEQYSQPCPIITGDWKLAAGAAYAMKDRPSVLFYYYNIQNMKARPTGSWLRDEDVNESGGMILWNADEVPDDGVPAYVKARFPTAVPIPGVIDIPYGTAAPLPPIRIRIATIPPPAER